MAYGYLHGVFDGREMDSTELSPIDLKYIERMRTVRYIEDMAYKACDAEYLKYMISKFRFNQLLDVYLAIYTAKNRGNLLDSKLEFDHEIMYVAVSTSNGLISCIVGYDIDRYTLQWYGEKGQESLLIPGLWITDSDLHVIVTNLIKNYRVFNKAADKRGQ